MSLENRVMGLALDADDAYVKTKKTNDEKSSAVEKFLSSTITVQLLLNFLNSSIQKSIGRGDFQVEIEEKDLSDFAAPYDVIAAAAIMLCSKQNYRARIKVDGSLFISWRSPSSIQVIPEVEKVTKPFVFHKPDELNIK